MKFFFITFFAASLLCLLASYIPAKKSEDVTTVDVFKKTIQVDGVDIEATEEQIDASKVIKYCAVDRKVIANRA